MMEIVSLLDRIAFMTSRRIYRDEEDRPRRKKATGGFGITPSTGFLIVILGLAIAMLFGAMTQPGMVVYLKWFGVGMAILGWLWMVSLGFSEGEGMAIFMPILGFL